LKAGKLKPAGNFHLLFFFFSFFVVEFVLCTLGLFGVFLFEKRCTTRMTGGLGEEEDGNTRLPARGGRY
jgi:hypothetical protein